MRISAPKRSLSGKRVPADLDVPLFHHVEQRDLDAFGEVGELVDGHDSAMRARHEAEVNGLRVAEAPAFGNLDRIDVADQVGDRGIRRRQLLGVPLAAVAPGDREVVAQLLGSTYRSRGDRLVRVLPQFRAFDDGRPLVEQEPESAKQPRLSLTSFAEQNHVVAGDQRPLELRGDRVLEPDYPGPGVTAVPQRGEKILS